MSYTCYLQLDTRRKKKNNLFPIIIRITVNRNSTSYSTNISIKENEWDINHLKIKPSAKSVQNTQRLNKYLNDCLSKAENILFQLSESQKLTDVSLSDIKILISRRIDGIKSLLTLEELINTHKEKLHKENRFGHARTFEDLRQFLVNYCGTADIHVSKLNFRWLSNLETEYISRGNSYNGLSVRLRALRTLINHNRKLGVLEPDFNPFLNYAIKGAKTRKRALRKADFDKILNADVQDLQASTMKARNYFLISYYMLGISFHDLALLKVESIQQGKIYYKRAKTKRLYAIKISKPLEKLLAEFLESKAAEDFLLPIAKKGLSPFEQDKRIRNSMGRYNKNLKKLATELGIESQMMSSYVARHSVATHARDISKIDIPIISQMLGHNDVSTTAVYLSSIEDHVVDEAIEKMFE